MSGCHFVFLCLFNYTKKPVLALWSYSMDMAVKKNISISLDQLALKSLYMNTMPLFSVRVWTHIIQQNHLLLCSIYWVWNQMLKMISLTHWGRDKMAAIFADGSFISIYVNENVWISIKISLKFVSKGPINYIPALVQIMAWSLPTNICVTWPQWVNAFPAWSCSLLHSSGNIFHPKYQAEIK